MILRRISVVISSLQYTLIVNIKAFYFLLIICSIQFSVRSQSYTFNETTYNVKKKLDQVVLVKENNSLLSGEIKFSNGTINCVEGQIVGQTLYYKNGNIRERCSYKNGLQHGLQEYYYSNGQLSSQFYLNSENPSYVNNRKNKQYIVGVYKVFYENGNLKMEENSNESGNLNGIQRYYYQNGQLQTEIEYSDGIVVQKRCWDESGIEILFCK
jgi:antitoxin component YwqK of YwqJK toxin-antitoxin module